jgi:hypothetical protein
MMCPSFRRLCGAILLAVAVVICLFVAVLVARNVVGNECCRVACGDNGCCGVGERCSDRIAGTCMGEVPCGPNNGSCLAGQNCVQQNGAFACCLPAFACANPANGQSECCGAGQECRDGACCFPCGNSCCRAGESCNSQTGTCCAGQVCGTSCCAPTEGCTFDAVQTHVGICCQSPDLICNAIRGIGRVSCCDPGELCARGSSFNLCCPLNAPVVCNNQCAGDRCPDGACCLPGMRCVPRSTGGFFCR